MGARLCCRQATMLMQQQQQEEVLCQAPMGWLVMLAQAVAAVAAAQKLVMWMKLS